MLRKPGFTLVFVANSSRILHGVNYCSVHGDEQVVAAQKLAANMGSVGTLN